MNPTNPIQLTDRYHALLKKHLDQPTSEAGMLNAHDWGTSALDAKLDTLDVAKIHDRVLGMILPIESARDVRDPLQKNASNFFSEAIRPMEDTHRLALDGKMKLASVNESLRQSSVALVESNRDLEDGIGQRKSAEAALKASEDNALLLLEESRRLEMQLQQITWEILSANEDERTRMSHMLQDEIAQTLVGIQLRLLVLNKKSKADSVSLTEAISNTEQLVEASVKTIDRLTREFTQRHE